MENCIMAFFLTLSQVLQYKGDFWELKEKVFSDTFKNPNC